MKRLVICCDGTWNQLDYAEKPVTNVVKLAQAVLPYGPHPEEANRAIPQLVYYDEGVGVEDVAVLGASEKVLGGAFGAGLLRNVEEAYRFIVFNYEPGDDIHIFGFSRGAFTARSLAGLIRNCGIVRREAAPRVPYAMRMYAARDEKPWEHDANRFRSENGYPGVYLDNDAYTPERGEDIPLRIGYLGVWDTVGMNGVVGVVKEVCTGEPHFGFHDAKLSSIIRRARQALALDERRMLFPPAPFDPDRLRELKANADSRRHEQRWFPGDHASVGGGGDITGLSDHALQWIAEGAEEAGLAYDLGRISCIYSGNDSFEGKFNPNYEAPLASTSEDWREIDRSSFLEQCFSIALNTATRSRREVLEDFTPADLSDVALRRWQKNVDGYATDSCLAETFSKERLQREANRLEGS